MVEACTVSVSGWFALCGITVKRLSQKYCTRWEENKKFVAINTFAIIWTSQLSIKWNFWKISWAAGIFFFLLSPHYISIGLAMSKLALAVENAHKCDHFGNAECLVSMWMHLFGHYRLNFSQWIHARMLLYSPSPLAPSLPVSLECICALVSHKSFEIICAHSLVRKMTHR